MKRGAPLVRRTRLRSMSEKRARVAKARAELVARALKARPRCQAGAVFEREVPGHRCEGRARDVHEVLARSAGGSILDEANVLAVCRRCHDAIGRHRAVAAAAGFWVSRFGAARTAAVAARATEAL